MQEAVERDRPHAAAAVHQARRSRRRSRALPDGVRAARAARSRRRPRACISARALLDALDERGVDDRGDHAARRLRHVPAGARRARRGPPARAGALRDRRSAAADAINARSTKGGASSPSARRRRARSRPWRASTTADIVAGSGATDLFIYPGFEFRVVGGLLTNFHLPQSSLLMLVCAFAGRERVLAAYREAIARALPVLQLRRRDVDRVRAFGRAPEGTTRLLDSPVGSPDNPVELVTLPNGTRLGPYEIVAPLGAGGMGEVYKARDTRLDRTVAIKILPDALAADPQFRERFDREARAISQLTHPHICDAVRRRRTSTAPRFLVMEYLEGRRWNAAASRRARCRSTRRSGSAPRSHRRSTRRTRRHRASRSRNPANIMLTEGGRQVARLRPRESRRRPSSRRG